MSFILMDIRAVKDNGGGISLNVVLKTEKKDPQAYEAEEEYKACYNQNVHVFTLEQRPWWMVQSRVPNFICPTNWIDAFLSSGSNAWHGGHHWTRTIRYINIGFLETSSCDIKLRASEGACQTGAKKSTSQGSFLSAGKLSGRRVVTWAWTLSLAKLTMLYNTSLPASTNLTNLDEVKSNYYLQCFSKLC